MPTRNHSAVARTQTETGSISAQVNLQTHTKPQPMLHFQHSSGFLVVVFSSRRTETIAASTTAWSTCTTCSTCTASASTNAPRTTTGLYRSSSPSAGCRSPPYQGALHADAPCRGRRRALVPRHQPGASPDAHETWRRDQTQAGRCGWQQRARRVSASESLCADSAGEAAACLRRGCDWLQGHFEREG